MASFNTGFYRKTLQACFFSALVALLLASASAFAASEFPGRKTYPDVKYIELQDLKAQFDKVTIVDVRSAYEFRTLRIKGALNIPVASSEFVNEVQKLRSSTVKPIVFYCNGKTCMKSYKAAQKASVAGVSDVHAYDAGIMDWAKAYPKDALLLEKELNDPRLLISKEQFKKHLLGPDDFANKVSSGKTLVLDVRDRFQRDALALFPGKERRVFLDQTKKLDKQIDRAKKQNRTLLIYDAAGKQVRWLQYYLEYKKVDDYFFMKGGARAFFSDITDSFLGKQ